MRTPHRTFAFFAFVAATAWAQTAPVVGEPAPLTLLQKLPLPDSIKGRFDHFGVDLKNNRLFATPEDAQEVLVLDLRTGAVIHEIRGVAKPHAVFYREDLDRIYVTDGVDGALKVFDGRTYQPVDGVNLFKDADSIGYDPSTKHLYIVNGGGDEGLEYSMLSIVDTTTDKKTAEIRIEGKTIEAMSLDAFRPRMYVNNPARNRVEVIDRWKKTVVASWTVTLAKSNVAMALDEQHQRLFVGCRSGQVVVFDTNTGRELQALPIGKGIDDLVYDVPSKRLYAAADGSVSTFEQTDADHYKPLASLATAPGAKTARLVPELNRYFVAVPQRGDQSAAVLVFEPAGVPAFKPVEPPVTLTVHAPAAQALLLSTLSAHPDIRKMGLHAIPPGQTGSAIIAQANASRIGVQSTPGDLVAVKDAREYCAKQENGSFYNMKLPLLDAARRRIGILVMEIPFTSAVDEADALHKAEGIRQELAHQIPSLSQLFENQ
jgi:DNA-binding beta-propeller fold protein YncE